MGGAKEGAAVQRPRPRKGNSAIYAEYDREMALPKAGLLNPPALIRLAERQKVQRQGGRSSRAGRRIAEADAASQGSRGNAAGFNAKVPGLPFGRPRLSACR